MQFRIFATGLTAFVLPACSPLFSGDADGAPVALMAGRYQVSHSSELPSNTSIKLPTRIAEGDGKTMCLDSIDDAAKLDKLVHDYMAKGLSCEQKDFKRNANTVTATQSCRTRSMFGNMRSDFRYSGVLTSQSVRLEGNILIDISKDAGSNEFGDSMAVYRDKVRDLDIVIEAKRIGGC